MEVKTDNFAVKMKTVYIRSLSTKFRSVKSSNVKISSHFVVLVKIHDNLFALQKKLDSKILFNGLVIIFYISYFDIL